MLRKSRIVSWKHWSANARRSLLAFFLLEADPSPRGMNTAVEGWYRLHTYQHRLIFANYRIWMILATSVAVALFGLILIIAFSQQDALGVVVLLSSVEILLAYSIRRMTINFRNYCKSFAHVQNLLRSISNPQHLESIFALQQEAEYRLGEKLSRRLGEEPPHTRWDRKNCPSCGYWLELLSPLCAHCGQSQPLTMAN